MRGDGIWRRRVAVVAAVGCGLATVAGAGVRPGAEATAAAQVAATGVTTTPILSVRRVPGWVAETVAAQRMSPSLTALLADPTLAGAAQTGCLVVSQGGRLLYAANPDKSLIPASNMKLLTATAVLDRLGAAHRITTRVLAGRPVRGSVTGNLYLVGAGDPLLRTPSYVAALGPDQTLYTSLSQLARQVRAAGVTEVTGSVAGDESRYDQMRTVPTWKPVYAAEGDVGPLSALEVNDGTAPTAPAPPPGASVSGLHAAVSANPAVRAAATFTTLLRADGVRVLGSPTTGAAPAATPALTTIASAPVGAEVDAMLTVSDDTAAELFTKELGYLAAGTGSTAAGAAAIRADLAADGLPLAGLAVHDGSGLDRGDRVTCDLIAADLQRAGAAGVLAKGLPVAGQTGTLRLRMRGTPAAGRLRAKTGTLDDVVGLSGFVLPAPGAAAPPGSVLGQPIVFALILDGVPTLAAGRAVADRIGVDLAGYPQLPGLAQLGPRPGPPTP